MDCGANPGYHDVAAPRPEALPAGRTERITAAARDVANFCRDYAKGLDCADWTAEAGAFEEWADTILDATDQEAALREVWTSMARYLARNNPDVIEEAVPYFAPVLFECDRCDGCGWYEGGVALIATSCEKCSGTGVVLAALAAVEAR